MEEARRVIEHGRAQNGELITADEQSQGRGRRGRSWESKIGNFFGSFILSPEVPSFKAAELSFVIALAVGQTVESLITDACLVRYKWPNDVLVDHCKVAGLLLEAVTVSVGAPPWIIIGVGINLQSHPNYTRIFSFDIF